MSFDMFKMLENNKAFKEAEARQTEKFVEWEKTDKKAPMPILICKESFIIGRTTVFDEIILGALSRKSDLVERFKTANSSAHIQYLEPSYEPWVPMAEAPESWRDGRNVDIMINGNRITDMRFKVNSAMRGGGKWLKANMTFGDTGYASCLTEHIDFIMLPPKVKK